MSVSAKNDSSKQHPNIEKNKWYIILFIWLLIKQLSLQIIRKIVLTNLQRDIRPNQFLNDESINLTKQIVNMRFYFNYSHIDKLLNLAKQDEYRDEWWLNTIWWNISDLELIFLIF